MALDKATTIALTEKFRQDESSVWNVDYIKDALLSSSGNKCCYCECYLNEEGKYLEVEHFLPKAIYPCLVLIWENLLPSCRRCNGRKSDHDTALAPIVNPAVDDPSTHLYLLSCRFYPRTDIGKTTREVLGLNDWAGIGLSRFRVAQKTLELVTKLLHYVEAYEASAKSAYKEAHIKRSFSDLLQEAQPSAEYSAVVATELLVSPEYIELEAKLRNLALVTAEMESLITIMASISLAP